MLCVRRQGSRTIALVVLTMAWGPPARAFETNSPYGAVAFIPSPTRFNAMQDADIAWGRYDFSWRSVEATSKGAYNWEVQDYAVAEANARGLNIYAGLGYTPAWASAGGNSYDPPTNYQDWYDYVYATVSRYKDSIHYWELWNEPNLTQFWNGTQAQFIELLKVGADAAHAADPDSMVLAPELSSAGRPSLWMTNILQQAGDKIDIISYHQYDGGDIPAGRLSAIDAMHNRIVAAGYANKPIWITESGWESDNIGEQTQADYLVAMLDGMASRPWMKKFFWYQIWEGPTGRAGLLYQDETPKPSWYAYRDYTLAHPAPQMVSVNLSTTDIADGINLVTVGDGNTTPDTKASRRCRRNTDATGGDYYMYFNVTDDFAFQGNRPNVAIDVDYYDLGSATLTLQYDSIGNGAYTSAGSFTLGNKDTWKQFTFYLYDAYFGNRQNNGADFRISAGVGTTFYLDLVQVSELLTDPGVPGDYNNNGTVDAADYTVWRDGGPLQNDATPGVQPGDYLVWRANFGKSAASNSSLPAIPEPSTFLLTILALAALRKRGQNDLTNRSSPSSSVPPFLPVDTLRQSELIYRVASDDAPQLYVGQRVDVYLDSAKAK